MKSAQSTTGANHTQSPCVVAEQEIERRPMPVGFSGYGEARNIAERGGCPYFHSSNGVFEKAMDAHLVANQAHSAATIVTAKLSE